MGNDPVNGVDPNGGFWSELLTSGTFLNHAVFTVAGGIAGALIGKNDGTGGLKSAGIGAGIGFGFSFVPWDVVGGAIGDAGSWVGSQIGKSLQGGDPQNGGGSSLYETPNGEPARTAQEWAEHYEGKSWDEISTENKGKHGDGYQRYLGGLIKFRLGPVPDWRYVKLDNGMVLDMRHVLVVGMKTHGGLKTGDKLGIFGEMAQLATDRKSAMAKQDYVSNFIGAKFLNYLQQNSPYYNPRNSTQSFGNVHETNISWHFYNFISNISFRKK